MDCLVHSRRAYGIRSCERSERRTASYECRIHYKRRSRSKSPDATNRVHGRRSSDRVSGETAAHLLLNLMGCTHGPIEKRFVCCHSWIRGKHSKSFTPSRINSRGLAEGWRSGQPIEEHARAEGAKLEWLLIQVLRSLFQRALDERQATLGLFAH